MTEREQFDQWLVEVDAKPGKMPTRWETWQAARAVQPQDVVDARRWRWLAGDCDGNAQDDLIRILSRAVLSKAEIDALVDAAMSPHSDVVGSGEET